MGNYIIGTIRKDKVIVGYRVFDVDNMEVHKISIETTEKMCSQYGKDLFLNAVWDNTYKGLTSTCSRSISSLPIADSGGTVVRNKGIAVVAIIEDANNEEVGCIAIDSYGMKANISFNKLDELSRKLVNINFELKVCDGSIRPYPLCGEDWMHVKMSKYKKSHYKSGLGEKEVSPTDIPRVPVYSINEVTQSEFNKPAQKKMFDAIAGLKMLCPYYWVLFQAIDRQPCDSRVCKTMGVTEDKLVYNLEFVSRCSVPELIFILIHEVDHIAMQHSVRKGKHRDHKKWNIACDLYINENILYEFGLQIGVESTIGGVAIQPPTNAYYMGAVGMSLDFSRDTPEIIYERLGYEDEQEDNNNGYGNNGSGGNSSGNDSDDSQSGESGGNSSEAGKGEQSDGDSGGDGSGSIFGDLDENASNKDNRTVTYNGKKLEGACLDDIMSNNGQGTKEAREEALEESKQRVQTMNLKKEMLEEKLGEKLSKQTTGTQLVQRYIDFGLSDTVDWQDVLKNMCKYRPKKQYTLASPNQDYMNMGITVASRRKIGKERNVQRIKICIDVSGSVSEEQLKWYLSEVANIFTKFKASGELIYWSTEVGDSGEFQQIKDLVKVKPNSTGGTDVSCVFDYLTGKVKTQTGKKEETKVKDILGVIIVTDGCFENNYKDYESIFGRKTLWLIDNNISFNPPFGRVLPLGSKRDK